MAIENTPVENTDVSGQPGITQTHGNPAPASETNTGQTTAQVQAAATEAARVAGLTPEAKAAEAQAARVAASKAATDAALGNAADGTQEVVVPEEWQYEGHPSADAALDLMKDAKLTKIDIQAIFGAAVASKDLTKIDQNLLKTKMGKQAPAVMALITQFHTETNARNTAIATMVHGIMGGPEKWNTVRDWAQAREKVDTGFAAELSQTRKMLEKGGLGAKLAAENMLKSYNADPKTKGLQNGEKVNPGVNAQGNAETAPLSRDEYLAAVKLENKKSNPSPAVLSSLSARRAAGRKLAA